MAEAHDLHEVIEYIKSAANTTPQTSVEPKENTNSKRGNKEKDDY